MKSAIVLLAAAVGTHAVDLTIKCTGGTSFTLVVDDCVVTETLGTTVTTNEKGDSYLSCDSEPASTAMLSYGTGMGNTCVCTLATPTVATPTVAKAGGLGGPYGTGTWKPTTPTVAAFSGASPTVAAALLPMVTALLMSAAVAV